MMVLPLAAAFPCACGVGLSLLSCRFISVPPVRGAPTFLCRPQRKVGKRKRLKPPTSKWVSWLGRAGGAINESHLGPLGSVTQPSSAPTPHYVRRGRVCQGNRGLRLRAVGPSASPRRGTENLSVLEVRVHWHRVADHTSGLMKYRPGARSAAGGMTAWSLRPAGAQAHSLRSHDTLQARGPA